MRTENKKRMPRAAGLMVSAVMVARFAAGCAADVVDERDVAESNSALKGTALNGATVTGVPVPGTTSKLTWPSTYPRLLAADAMAECTLIQRVGITDGGTTDPDPFFAGLANDMNTTISDLACSWPSPAPAGYTTPELFMNRWIEGRKVSTCNIDLAAQQGRGITTNYIAVAGSTSPYAIPTAAQYTAASPAPAFTNNPSTDTTLVSQARNKAQDQVHYAWLNLCVAQKLREHLESFQSAVTSEDDLLELQAIVRQRSLAAVYQYATLIKTMDTTAPTAVISNPWQYASLIRYWPTKDALFAGNKGPALGRDIAMATQLLVELSEQHTDSLLRSASAKGSNFGSYSSMPLSKSGFFNGLDSGLDGPRAETLAYAYGPQSWSSTRASAVDMHAPEIGTLLALARRANALLLTGVNKGFDITANATTLLNAVEVYVRGQDCTALGNPTGCSSAIPAGTTPDQYVVRQRFNIQPIHAQILFRALLEHLYGYPPQETFNPSISWTYQFDTQNVLNGLPMDLLDRLPGTHTYSGGANFASATSSSLRLDVNTELSAPPATQQEEQTWTYIPQRTHDFTMHPYDQGFAFRNEIWQTVRYGRNSQALAVGSQAGLAYLRYVLARAKSPAAPIINAAGAPLWRLLETAGGSRQVVIRRALTTNAASTSCAAWTFLANGTTSTTPATCVAPADNGSTVDVVVNTKVGDPYTSLAMRTMTSPIAIGTTKTMGTLTAETIDASFASSTNSELIRRFTIAVAPPAAGVPPTSIELRLEDASGNSILLHRGPIEAPIATAGTPIYTPTSYIPTAPYQRGSTFARVANFGGTVNRMIDRAFEPQQSNWSKPHYDAFDLPTDWAPVGDASLHGGQPGQEAYQYFLQAATTASTEATSAIDKALEGLSLEIQDTVASQQNSQKAQSLTSIEEKSFCGAAAKGKSTTGTLSCAPTKTRAPITVPACPSGTVPGGLCSMMNTYLTLAIGAANKSPGIELATDVYNQRNAVVADFSAYDGGQIESLLQAQWNAWKNLNATLTVAIAAAASAESEIAVANAEKTASDTEYNSTLVTKLGEIINLLANNAAQQAQITTLRSDWTQYSTNVGSAHNTAIKLCSPSTYDTAVISGYSFSGRNRNPTWDSNNGSWEIPASSASDGGSRSWSPGPYEAAQQQCDTATQQASDLQETYQPKKDSIDAGISAANAIIVSNNFTAYFSIPAQMTAALARAQVAPKRVESATAEGITGCISELQMIQQALGDLQMTGVQLAQGANQATLAKARIDLDAQFATVDLQTRFNLRRAFRSYDLWRARALSENARRLAVAARRAIEARFVVDLSALTSAETFVEAPALWANEVYLPDLNPPSALGRTSAPTDKNGIYSSKLQDYVNNLQLFVNGYAISRPTATVHDDSEVFSLSAPAAVSSTVAADGTTFLYRDIEAAGWSFFCPPTNTWIRNPDSATFNAPSWTLSTACVDPVTSVRSAPTRARLSFRLDPWGRPQGVIANPPYMDRHNARWGELAVNLVGSGIRDCSLSRDPATCYSEPFIRYSFRHVGPAMLTDFQQSWTSMEIPEGNIEGGKALASEEWVDPVSNGFQNSVVASCARQEFVGRPLGGAYELVLELSPDVDVQRIERIQVLMHDNYWVRQR